MDQPRQRCKAAVRLGFLVPTRCTPFGITCMRSGSGRMERCLSPCPTRNAGESRLDVGSAQWLASTVTPLKLPAQIVVPDAHWFGSALHCSINWQCSNVVGRGACVFALSIGCSGIVPLTDKSMALACRYRPATRKAGILTMDRIRDPERSKNRYARFWRAANLLRAGKRTVSM